MAQPTQATQQQRRTYIYGYALALLAHIIWGSYPVIGKRLLQSVPPFSLIALGYIVVILLSVPIFGATFREALQPRRLFRRATLLLLAAVSARSVTNILSLSYTLAIYVQLINLMTPFAVALLGQALFREPIPRRTYPALLLSTFGSALIVLGGSQGTLGGVWRSNDTIGIALALTSTVCLALYMLLARHVQHGERRSSPWEVLVQQMVALELISLSCAIIASESWSAWGSLPSTIWLLFGAFVLINLLGGNFIQLAGLRYLNTALFTSLMGTRLVSALVLAWLLLGERLTSLWQALGAVIVVTTITWYLRAQVFERRGAKGPTPQQV